jgi:ribonucleoside-diphosphate reductase alpha chain
MANSIIDYVFRSLGIEYLERDDLAQVPPNRSGDLPEPPKGVAVEAGMQLDLTDAAMESDIDAQVAAAKFVDAEVVGGGPSIPAALASPNGTEPLSGAAAVTAALNGGATQAAVATVAAEYSLSEMMGDAPACQGCGHMTVRNGSCYVCLTCGDTTGCS